MAITCPPATFSESYKSFKYSIKRFKLLANYIFQCYRPQTWQFYLFFPANFISSIHKVPSVTFKDG